MTVYEVVQKLPEISVLRDRCRAMAMLDAILSVEQGCRLYSYDSQWSSTEEMASMVDGSGNDSSIVFSEHGVWARAFDHESPMSPAAARPPALWPGLLDSAPSVFRRAMRSPAFRGPRGVLRATACFWRETSDPAWRCGRPKIPVYDIEPLGADGADYLFELVTDGTPEAYHQYAELHWGDPVDIDPVRQVYAMQPLTQEIVTRLSPELELELAFFESERARIGYPRGS